MKTYSRISPQTLDPHLKESTGAEEWSDRFVYPNGSYIKSEINFFRLGWHFGSHKRVLLKVTNIQNMANNTKETPQSLLEYIIFMLKYKPIYRSTLLFLCYSLMILTSLYLLWRVL
jgi:hypothetical protein